MIGIVGKKCGMTRVFTDDGRSVPVTIVQANPNLINRIKTEETDGYNAIRYSQGNLQRTLRSQMQDRFDQTQMRNFHTNFMSLD